MNKTLTVLYIVLIVVCIAGIVFLISYLRSDATSCLQNPFIYGAKKMGNNVQCRCTQDIPIEQNSYGRCPPQFFFNATTFNGASDCSGISM